MEEADEVVFWLTLLIDGKLAPIAAADELLQEAKELLAIFAASYRTARRNLRSSAQ